MTDNIKSQVKRAIITVLEDNEEIIGTESLTNIIGARKWYLIKCARAIQRDGLITILTSHGGRGHKTVYRRNRNQPGMPRKVKAAS